MNIEIEKFETGWFDLNLRLSESDIEELITNLEKMKNDRDYFFNIQSSFEGSEPSLSNLRISLGIEEIGNNVEMYPLG